jgi:hypothetical protein
MVTLRRDVAAAAKNKVFDKTDRDSETMTDYDLFMEKKRQQRSLCNYTPARPMETNPEPVSQSQKQTDKSDALSKIFVRADTEKKETPALTREDYKKYLIDQLNRREPGILLSEEDFYKQHSSGATAEAPPVKKEKTENVKLSKNGKIFVAVYVLVVAVVASIILAVNSVGNRPAVNARAIGGSAEGSIAPMDLPEEQSEGSGNWFDKLLDGLSNG